MRAKLLTFCLCFKLIISLSSSVEVDQKQNEAQEESLASEVANMKTTIRILSDQWEKWNTLFITSLEPRITSTASTLSSIDSNIHNLQERAHVWDTFQLHVAAWNDQLASMDRKIDIMNKAMEQVTSVESKMNTILSKDYKLDKIIKMTESLLESSVNLENTVKSKKYGKSSKDSLFEEFAVRGILSSLKLVERKVDQLLSTRKNNHPKLSGNNEDVMMKYTISSDSEGLIHDISSKVDIIFDSLTKNNDNINDEEEYLDVKDVEGSGNSMAENARKVHKLDQTQANQDLRQEVKHVSEKVKLIDSNVINILYKLNDQQSDSEECPRKIYFEDISMRNLLNNISTSNTKHLSPILESFFKEERTYWISMFNELGERCLSDERNSILSTTERATHETIFPVVDTTTEYNIKSTNWAHTETIQGPNHKEVFHHSVEKHFNMSSCNDLEDDSVSGIYHFNESNNNFLNERFTNKQFCEMRDNGLWIVIQRRDNYSIQQDFNVSWNDYKLGFGELEKDFWIGNNYLSRLSRLNNLTLRIELEDFDGNYVWAEYKEFKVAPEFQQFRLTVGGYYGNASDSMTTHNGSFFSTYDRKNDEAPECCPCSVSYGGGWWFNKCFESNLNGAYYKRPFENDYFRGVIWEHWLGNYSLKRSLMMVKPRGSTQFYSSSTYAQIEDP